MKIIKKKTSYFKTAKQNLYNTWAIKKLIATVGYVMILLVLVTNYRHTHTSILRQKVL